MNIEFAPAKPKDENGGREDIDRKALYIVGRLFTKYFQYEIKEKYGDRISEEEKIRFLERRLPVYFDALERGYNLILDKLEKKGDELEKKGEFSVEILEERLGRTTHHRGVKKFTLKQNYEEGWYIESQDNSTENREQREPFQKKTIADVFSESIHWEIKPTSNDPFDIERFYFLLQRFGLSEKALEGETSFWQDPSLIALAFRIGLEEQKKIYADFVLAISSVSRLEANFRKIIHFLPTVRKNLEKIKQIDSKISKEAEKIKSKQEEIFIEDILASRYKQRERELSLTESFEDEELFTIFDSKLNAVVSVKQYLKFIESELSKIRDSFPTIKGKGEISDWQRSFALILLIEPEKLFKENKNKNNILYLFFPESDEDSILAFHRFIQNISKNKINTAKVVLTLMLERNFSLYEERIKKILQTKNIHPEYCLEYLRSFCYAYIDELVKSKKIDLSKNEELIYLFARYQKEPKNDDRKTLSPPRNLEKKEEWESYLPQLFQKLSSENTQEPRKIIEEEFFSVLQRLKIVWDPEKHRFVQVLKSDLTPTIKSLLEHYFAIFNQYAAQILLQLKNGDQNSLPAQYIKDVIFISHSEYYFRKKNLSIDQSELVKCEKFSSFFNLIIKNLENGNPKDIDIESLSKSFEELLDVFIVMSIRREISDDGRFVKKSILSIKQDLEINFFKLIIDKSSNNLESLLINTLENKKGTLHQTDPDLKFFISFSKMQEEEAKDFKNKLYTLISQIADKALENFREETQASLKIKTLIENIISDALEEIK